MGTLGARIKKLREDYNLKQSQLANRVGVKSGAVISNWEKDVNKPDADKIVQLCLVLDTTANYLLGCPEKDGKLFFTKDEADLILRFRKLDNYGRKTIFTLVDLEYSRMSEILNNASKNVEHKNDALNQNNLIKMKVYPQKASAGTGNYTFDDLGCEELLFDKSSLPENADFGVYIKGDSMEPKVFDGDVVWVSQCPAIENNEIGIFILNDESFCKKAVYDNGQLYLVSLNKKYFPIEIKEFDELHVIGKVLL